MHGDRGAGLGLLALLYAVSGGLCALGSLRPASPDTPVDLLGALAVVGLGGAVLLWAGRNRLSEPTVHIALAVDGALLGVLAWQSATPAGIVGLGPAMVVLGVFAGHFLAPAAARAHVAFLLTVTTAGAIAAAPSGFGSIWFTALVTVAVLTEAQSRSSARLVAAAGTDALTGLANRRAWEQGACRSLAHAQRRGEPLTVAVIDLDGFKAVNDEDGHAAGDALLRSLARAWSCELRRADLLGRFGGDEFVLCLPGTDRATARDLLVRLHESHPAAWSAGTAAAWPADTLHDLLDRADEELYRCKRARIH